MSIPAFVCEEPAAHLIDAPKGPDALVFRAGGGGPLRHANFLRYVWQPAVRAARLPEGLTPHELRHTAASLFIAQGAGPKSVQAQLGHSTITTTFDTYGHLFEGHLDDVMEQLDSRWREARSATGERATDAGSDATVLGWPEQRNDEDDGPETELRLPGI